MNAEGTDETQAREVAEWHRQYRRPLCPQFRQAAMEGSYPVRGYCVLAEAAGWFMIPSIEEYQGYCTTARFGGCCWFGGMRESFGSVEGQRGELPARTNAWDPPDVAHPLLRDHT